MDEIFISERLKYFNETGLPVPGSHLWDRYISNIATASMEEIVAFESRLNKKMRGLFLRTNVIILPPEMSLAITDAVYNTRIRVQMKKAYHSDLEHLDGRLKSAQDKIAGLQDLSDQLELDKTALKAERDELKIKADKWNQAKGFLKEEVFK